jgi:hypothetical protein
VRFRHPKGVKSAAVGFIADGSSSGAILELDKSMSSLRPTRFRLRAKPPLEIAVLD